MIERIELNNFQSHKQTVLEMDPGVNIIIGSSDSGKSAIIRAISWVVTNTPLGDAFIRYGSEGTQIKITLSKGDTITREKTKSKNKYTLFSYAVEECVFEGFGQTVPAEIDSVLNFSNINIQYQMDSPFLISETSGEISKYLNKIVNLDSIDVSLKNLASMKRKIDQEVTILKRQYEDLNKQKEDFTSLLEIEELIIQGEKVDEQREEIILNISSISDLIANVQEIKEELKTHTTLDEEKQLVEQGLSIWNETTDLMGQRNGLLSLKNNYEKEQEKYERHGLKLNSLKQKYKKLMPDECPLCGNKIKEK